MTTKIASHPPIRDNHDVIDEHARQAWSVAELLIEHFSGERDTLSDEVMTCLMEDISSHLARIRDINAEIDSLRSVG